MMAQEEVSKNPWSSEKYPAIDTFLEILDEKLFEARDILIERYKWICSQNPASAKFMYENGVMMGFDGKTIESAMKHGTLAIGQLGLAETLQILIGTDHTTEEGMNLAKRIENLFKLRCAEFKKDKHLNFGVYYTPAENLLVIHILLKTLRNLKNNMELFQMSQTKIFSLTVFMFLFGNMFPHMKRLILKVN